MAKRIDSSMVIGNALIFTKKAQITKEELYQYYEIVDKLLPNDYYTAELSFDSFCYYFDFLVKRIDDTIIIDCDTELLQRYFQMGISIEILNIFELSAIKLNEMGEQTSQITSEQENIFALRKRIKSILKS